ncbi:MAG TPA: polynucleotide adenylyltransferase PcnB [Casimicrobiaceae bacterium]|jgi:poly(A) polymerase|nr:polynucleotide adenylyltransferase PcnB [Casimicrobiaceae bacterium]
MMRRLLARLLPGRPTSTPRVYQPDRHPVRRDQLSSAARTVTRRLQEEGFRAFIVGGAVRDLLLGIEPKDFDIATDATPEQVKPLFRRAFIIGRRFRLVHVHVGNDVIEVSTFRAAQAGNDSTDEHGRLLSDNVYGSQAEDAVRRDFTINALYFDPATDTIWDYVGGVVDIRARRLKLIGPPITRYREDPVRMLRAVRLAAKLGLSIERRTEEPISRLASLMANVPPARLFDEMQKLLLSGHAAETLRSLRAHGLSHGLLPLLDVILEQPLGQKFIDAALAGTDARVRADKGVSPAFLFATLLWHEVLVTWKAAKERGERPLPALFDAMDKVLAAQAQRIAIPRRFEATIKEIWSLQPRFEQRAGTRPARLLEHPRFRAAYDFLALRAESGEAPQALVDWWTRFQQATPEERDAMLRPDEAPKKPRRSRSRNRKRRSATTGEGVTAPGDE